MNDESYESSTVQRPVDRTHGIQQVVKGTNHQPGNQHKGVSDIATQSCTHIVHKTHHTSTFPTPTPRLNPKRKIFYTNTELLEGCGALTLTQTHCTHLFRAFPGSNSQKRLRLHVLSIMGRNISGTDGAP